VSPVCVLQCVCYSVCVTVCVLQCVQALVDVRNLVQLMNEPPDIIDVEDATGVCVCVV